LVEKASSGEARNEFLFQHLIAMFQTLAFQQMGKLINPITNKLERDLQQARITIDMLQMLKEKTKGNLTESEEKLLDGVIFELQMNYVDEVERQKAESQKEESEKMVEEVRGEDKEKKSEITEDSSSARKESSQKQSMKGEKKKTFKGRSKKDSKKG